MEPMFYVKSWTDEELEELLVQIKKEQKERKVQATLRKNWVERQVEEFRRARGRWTSVGNTVIVAVISKENHISMAQSYCSNADEFNINVGIAVAYARTKGEKVPKYI